MVKAAAVLTALLAVTFSQSLYGQQGLATDSRYSGSQRCGQCHEGEYNYWKITPHASMARVPDWRGSEQLRNLAAEGLPFPKETVDIVIGNLKVLVFLKRKGQDFVPLPKQYNLNANEWEDFTEDEWEPHLGKSGPKAQDGEVSWKQRCAGCHTTGFNASTNEFVELSVGCEECHGPGAVHSRTTNKDDIINPRSLSVERTISICGRCHSRGMNKDGTHPFPTTFVPGDLLSDHFDLLSPKPGVNTEAFWGNGMARRHHQQYQEFLQSKHYEVGLACIDCHEGHKFRLRSVPKGSKALWARTEMVLLAHRSHSVCLRCHTAAESEFVEVITISQGSDTPQIKSIEQHSRHPLVLKKTKPDGSIGDGKMLCNDCHMPMTAPAELAYPMHTHTFRAPNPEATLQYGVPNACNQCHSDKSPAWASEQRFARWVLPRFMADFERAEVEYSRFQSFMSDADPKRRAKLEAVTPLFKRVLGFMGPLRDKGGATTRAIPDRPALKTILDNVESTDRMIAQLDSMIDTWEEDTRAELDGLLDIGACKALNRVLRAQKLPEISPPPIAESYGKTVEAFVAFNRSVSQKGRSFFEEANRRTPWQTWVEIHEALARGTYRQKPDHDISELEQMGLIKKSFTLEP